VTPFEPLALMNLLAILGQLDARGACSVRPLQPRSARSPCHSHSSWFITDTDVGCRDWAVAG